MNLSLKFITDIIRPWERLNQELVNQNSIDRNISELLTIAEDLSIKLSHFPESAGQKAVRSNKNSSDFNTIVDIADATKHDKLKDVNRNNELSLSSMFEGRDNETFRFIRNKIIITHDKYGKSDFLETFKKAANFLFTKLNLIIFWNPNILEASNLFSDKVFLSIHYQHQIAWSGLQIEFFKRTDSGELIPYDPPKYLFELRSYHGITAQNYFDYLFQLFENSIDKDEMLSAKVNVPISNSTETYYVDFTIKNKNGDNKGSTIVQILNEACSISEIQAYQNNLQKTKSKNIILVSKNDFSKEIKEFVSISCRDVFLVSISKQDAENIPIGFFKINYRHSNFKMTAIKSAGLGILKEDEHLFADMAGKPISEFGDNFSLDKINLMSFKTFCLSQVKQKNDITSGTTKLTYKPRDKKNIYFKINDIFVKIGFEVDFDWEIENLEMHMPILTFNQAHIGISIWNLETNYQTDNGINQLSFQVIKYGDTSAIGMI